MDDFLSAAKEFDETVRHSKGFDMGAALLLEYFALPVLQLTKYVRIKERLRRPSVEWQLREVLQNAPPFIREQFDSEKIPILLTQYPEYDEALTLIGHGLHKRYKSLVMTNRLSRILALLVPLLYVGLGAAIVRVLMDERAIQLGVISAAWLLALGTTTLVCLKNLHWKPVVPPTV